MLAYLTLILILTVTVTVTLIYKFFWAKTQMMSQGDLQAVLEMHSYIAGRLTSEHKDDVAAACSPSTFSICGSMMTPGPKYRSFQYVVPLLLKVIREA